MGTATGAWLSKGVRAVTGPLVTIKQGSKAQAHMLFVLDASTPKLQAKPRRKTFRKGPSVEKSLLLAFEL